jgi:redox-sensitive bicupin YhaK (pirin superfamily)
VSEAIETVIEARPRPVGTTTVARVLPALRRRTVGPFVFFDHMGPVTLAAGQGFDVPPHPHIGLSTVTYFFAGENVHRDSLGTTRTNRPGDVNVMTAGAGVVHSERADPELRARGGVMHAAQIWLGLPTAHEDDPPSFAHHPAATLPAIAPTSPRVTDPAGAAASAAPAVRGRVLCGAAWGQTSPIAHPSRPLLVDLELDAGASLELAGASLDPDHERAVLVITGAIAIDDQELATDHLAALHAGAPAVIVARGAARVMLLGGPPLDGPRHLDWNFVSSSKEKLARARDRWRAREFPTIPGDDEERVEYPDWKEHP